MPAPDAIIVRELGQQAYQPTLEAMRAFTQNRSPSTADEIWLVQHPPVYTQGRNSKAEHLLDSGGIEVVNIDRGGQITYHGPGQLLAYLLVDLSRAGKGVRHLVTAMEQSVITLLERYGIAAEARQDAPGVYVNGAKIAALGLRITRGRSYHGLSLNIDMDLRPFAGINPCGYPGMAVTQCRDLGISDPLSRISEKLCALLSDELGYNGCVYESTKPAGL